jgi:hypothetical protein
LAIVDCDIKRKFNRTSGPGLFAKQRAPANGSVLQAHGIPPFSRA